MELLPHKQQLPSRPTPPFHLNSPQKIITNSGSHELYIQSCIQYLTTTTTTTNLPSSSLPIQTVVLNARGCSNTKITTPRLFSAGDTEDLEHALAHIRKRMGNQIKIIGVGYSLGANLLVGVSKKKKIQFLD